MAKKIKLAHLI